jgi:N-acetyl-anhydromuramyl-L-alanine amidase AmpD
MKARDGHLDAGGIAVQPEGVASRLPIVIDPAKPEDYGSRANTPVDCIVLHTTEGGSIAGATTWWDRDDVTASSHYVLDGQRIVQRVPEGMAAFHAGNRAVNRRSIGIEVVGHAGKASTWTPEVMAQLVELSAEIVERHAIPVHRGIPGIAGHCDVPDPRHPDRRGGAGHHVDPGPHLPWLAFFDTLRTCIAQDEAEGAVPPRPVPEPTLRRAGE